MKGVDVKEKESKDVGPGDGVQSFPTIVMMKNGKEVKRIEGSRQSGGEIMKELGLTGGGSRRRRTHRRDRKLARRTLRNYKSLA